MPNRGACVGREELTVLHNSIGGFYAFLLSRDPNVELSVVARSNLEAIKRNVCHEGSYSWVRVTVRLTAAGYEDTYVESWITYHTLR